MAKNQQTINVVMPTYLWCYREILRGIGIFANAKATWRVNYFTPQDNIINLTQLNRPDGIILGPIEWDPLIELADSVTHSVGICHPKQEISSPMKSDIGVADERVGEMAAEYFISKKYSHFAFIGYGEDWSGKRLDGYRKYLKHYDIEPHTFTPDWEPLMAGRGWKMRYPNDQVTPFIDSLPKPLAVLACNDIRGREVVEACKLAGVRIPEDVAIMGVDNDPLDCELSSPALSSVSIPWHRIGYLAAQQLSQSLDGEPSGASTLVPPAGVIERQSTDSIAISDKDVSNALIYIRENAHISIGVEDILKSVASSRRALEKKFQQLLGRTLHDEIKRVHLDRAKYLLGQTDMPIADVARNSGYSNFAWFSKLFGAELGLSPANYRKKFRR